MVNEATWRRLGSEAHADDVRAGHAAPIERKELAALLAAHFDADLVCLRADEREAALDALVDGYMHGG